MQEKTKVAILGGGMGALTTAFMLTDRPELRDRYDITVYQMGWRLGGKGASGRNHERGERIEEHGPHFFMGFYSNAFWLMQKCYRELARPATAPLARWDDAFKPQSLITLMERRDDAWTKWPLPFPFFDDVQPGFPDADEIPSTGGEPSTVWEYVTKLLGWLGDTYERLPAEVQLVNLGALLHHAREIAEAIPQPLLRVRSPLHDIIAESLDRFVRHLEVAVEDHLAVDDAIRRLWILLRLGAAIAHGLIEDRVVERGFDPLDGEDFRQWLGRHGAPQPAVWSAPVQAIYDLVFAYERGDTAHPNLAAGTALRGTLRLFFDYKGAFLWKMQAGMGDVVFAPLYQVLKRRGVKFRFFHRIENLGLSPNRNLIDTIDLTIQATVKPGLDPDGEYSPLYPVKDLPCWPSEPLYDQLVQGEQLKQVNLESAWTTWQGDKMTLRRSQDFDVVLLGISLGPLPFVCRELITARPDWQELVGRVQTVQTQAAQLWLKLDARGLGWDARERAMIGSYAQPWNAWVDMSQLIDREDFPSHPVHSIAYSCGPLTDSDVIPDPGKDGEFPARESARVKQQLVDFLRTMARPLWPRATDPRNPAGLDWALVVDLFWRGNIDPCERYVLSVQGSTGARLRAGDSGFDNLYLAGDWTATGLNVGCAEAAVMSGMQAARKICGHPWRVVGETDVLL
jgi:uncharacterized protein with NAD-binding domain and iron-sulfur cluster